MRTTLGCFSNSNLLAKVGSISKKIITILVSKFYKKIRMFKNYKFIND